MVHFVFLFEIFINIILKFDNFNKHISHNILYAYLALTVIRISKSKTINPEKQLKSPCKCHVKYFLLEKKPVIKSHLGIRVTYSLTSHFINRNGKKVLYIHTSYISLFNLQRIKDTSLQYHFCIPISIVPFKVIQQTPSSIPCNIDTVFIDRKKNL